MDLPSALNVHVPEMLRGACIVPVPPTALQPLVAAAAALCCGVVLRSAVDLGQPVRIGDPRESGRQLLQYCMVVSLTVLFWFGLTSLAGSVVPLPEKLGPWLRDGVGAYGALLAARALVRMQVVMFRPVHEAAVLSPLDEREARMRATEEPAPHVQGGSAPGAPAPVALLNREPISPPEAPAARNIPSFLIGVALLALALQGWNTESLCLWRLPR